jgi:hypothetical protein
LDVPLHFGNWHFGGAQERKGSVDTCIISKTMSKPFPQLQTKLLNMV